MFSCFGWSSSAAVAPLAQRTATVLPLDPAVAAAPLVNLSSSDPSLALAAARGLCERTGGPEKLSVRVLQLGSESNYNAVCTAEVAAGAQQHLLACLASHDKCVPIIECVAHCVRNLCTGFETRAGRRSALFPTFAPLAAAAAWLATTGDDGREQAADAAWLAMSSLIQNCSESECATGLLYVPEAASALAACAARQGLDCYGAANFLTFLCDAAAGFELREIAHKACHICLSPLLGILRSGGTLATAQAARAILSMLNLKDACACYLSPCVLCDTTAPTALPAVAYALTRNSSSGRVCKLLVDILHTLEWEDCACHAEVQLAVEALLACLKRCKALAAVNDTVTFFLKHAVLALGAIYYGRQKWHWQEHPLFEKIFDHLVALLLSNLCDHSTAGALGTTLGFFANKLCTDLQLRRVARAAPVVIKRLMSYQESSYALSGAAFFLKCIYRATRRKRVRTYWIFGPFIQWSGFRRIQASLLPHMSALLRALATACSDHKESHWVINVFRDVSELIEMILQECCELEVCPYCKTWQAACLPAAPLLLKALKVVAAHSNSSDGYKWAWAGVNLADSVLALSEHCTGVERNVLVMDALEPLVAVISAYSVESSEDTGESSEDTVEAAVRVLSEFIKEGAARAKVLAHHVPALLAAADRLQPASTLLDPWHFTAHTRLLRLLKHLGVQPRLMLLHLPQPDAAQRLRSCLECWLAAPRRACPDAQAHGELLDCAICRAGEETVVEAEASMVVLHCGHVFHMRCLTGWVKAQRARKGSMCCPLDKSLITRLAAATAEGQGAPGFTPIEEAAEEGRGSTNSDTESDIEPDMIGLAQLVAHDN